MNKTNRFLYLACLVFISAFLFCCKSCDKSINVMTFNVQNLFDGIENGEEYASYRPPKWNKHMYENRLIAIGKAIQSVDQTIDVLVLQEVENEDVVYDLHRYYLPAFTHIAVTKDQHSAVEVAVMSRHTILSVNTHTLQSVECSRWVRGLRPVLNVSIAFSIPPYQKMQILAVHLKSHKKSRSSLSSDEIRLYQYKLIASLIDTRIPSIIAGDFNDTNPEVRFIHYDARILKPPTSTHEQAQDYQENAISGTYYYNLQWQHIDHVLIDSVFYKIIEKAQNTIMAHKPFITDKGLPNRFLSKHKGRRYIKAVSDHLPVLFTALW